MAEMVDDFKSKNPAAAGAMLPSPPGSMGKKDVPTA